MKKNLTKKAILDWSEIVTASGSKEVAKDIMDMYINSLPDSKKIIQAHFSAKEYKAMREAVHKLTGTVAFFSPQLKKASHSLETALKDKDIKALEPLVNSVNELVDQVLAEYNNF
jgi:two-component system sensor histidine kinase BarA